MKYFKYYLVLIMGALLFFGCESNPVFKQLEKMSTVQINLGVNENSSGLAKAMFVEKVMLKISGPGLDTQNKQLTIRTNNGQREAYGKYDVKQGDNRTFEIEGKDAGDNRLFHGSRTVDLNEQELTISIPIQWDPFQVVYDDNEFNEGWYADEPYTEFITQFISPITPVHVIGARVYGASPLGHSFNYDIDFYDTNGDYIDTYDAILSNSNGDWNSYDLTSMGLNFSSDFYVSLYFYDGPDGNGAYGPVIGLDTDNQGNSYLYLPSTDTTSPMSGHWGLRVVVEVSGVTKELVPAHVQLQSRNEKSLHLTQESASFAPQIGILGQFNLADFE